MTFLKSWGMAGMIALLLGMGVLSGCASTLSQEGVEVVEVWSRPGIPGEEVETPAGFSISPGEAYVIVIRSRRLSLKHNWTCYRDDRRYYIYDSFVSASSAENALRQGVRVNGVTGAIEEREAREK